MKFVAAPPPLNLRDVIPYALNEFRRIMNAWGTEVNLEPLAVEPREAADGVIAYADGVSWNPGAGAGFYGRQSGAWVKL